MSARKSRAVIAITGAALFMVVLDNLIVLSTLPAIGRSLHVPLADLEWVVNAYILSFAVLMLTGAALGERFGRRRVFVGGLVLFSAASAAAALAPTGGLLIVARLVQGAGGAVLMPLTLTLLSAAFPPERRAAALGMWSAISGLGVALGPIAGGLLTDALSWHWIFWINVPIGIAAAAIAPRVLEESFGRRERLDLGGLALASGALLAVVWTTVRGKPVGWGAPLTLLGYAAGIALAAGFVSWEQRRAQPMLPLRLFRSHVFSTSNVAGAMLHFAMFGAFFLVIQFLAHVRGDSPVTAGLWTLPWTLMPLFVSPLAARLSRRVPAALLTAAGLALISAGIFALAAVVAPGTAELALALPLLSIGVGIGLVLPNVTALAVGAVPAPDIGKASGTLSTARQIGSVFGVAVAVAIFEASGSYSTALVAAGTAALIGALTTATIVPRFATTRLEPSPVAASPLPSRGH
jgi:EmrB/QacA subfamily drug resistance transporter